jgi:hypothetical protein
MPKTFDPDTELPDLSGKVIVVTGGTNLPVPCHVGVLDAATVWLLGVQTR